VKHPVVWWLFPLDPDLNRNHLKIFLKTAQKKSFLGLISSGAAAIEVRNL